jgi:hypothetical protein
MWKELVPDSGQAVQGELVRALGRLTDEAYRNGNINFDDGHRLFCEFLRVKPNDSSVFSAEEINEINRSIERVLDVEHPDVSGPAPPF